MYFDHKDFVEGQKFIKKLNVLIENDIKVSKESGVLYLRIPRGYLKRMK